MKQLHTFLSQFLCIFCASLLLVGCSYFDTDEEAMLKADKDMEVVEMHTEIPSQPINTSEAVLRSTGGSVTLYDLDGGVPVPQYKPVRQDGAVEVAAAPAVPVGQSALMPEPPMPHLPMVYAGDSSVEIFPLDDGMFTPVAAAPAHISQPAKTEEYVALHDGNGERVVIYFDHDSATLNQHALAKIASVAGAFNNAAGRGMTVEGHASIRANYEDEAQRRVVNLKISMNRAFAVASELIQQGIPAEAIRVMAWGDARPSGPVQGKTAEEASRRVEISS